MKKLLKVLVFAAAAFALFHGEGTSLIAQNESPFHDCITQGDYDLDYLCTAPQQVLGDPNWYFCSSYGTQVNASFDCEDDDPYADCDGGDQSQFLESQPCGTYTTIIGQPKTYTCPNDTYYEWGDDSEYCDPFEGGQGWECNLDSQCPGCQGCVNHRCQDEDANCPPGFVCVNAACMLGDGEGGDCDGAGYCEYCVSEGGACDWDCDCGVDGYDDQMECDKDGYCESDADDEIIVVGSPRGGYSLTDPQGGVQFNTVAGVSRRVAWTEAGSETGILALVLRDQAGAVDAERVLAGLSLRPEPPVVTRGAPATSAASTMARIPSAGLHQATAKGRRARGALAVLAAYDEPAYGGNGDSLIDARDAVYSSLRVWVDSNHNGVADPGELFTLPQLGITSISLAYQEDRRKDSNGNRFTYKTRIIRNGATQWISGVRLKRAR